MKRCPECRRDYYDETLLYCLDDGSALLEGPASADEPATAILSEPPAAATGLHSSESPTRTYKPDEKRIVDHGSAVGLLLIGPRVNLPPFINSEAWLTAGRALLRPFL